MLTRPPYHRAFFLISSHDLSQNTKSLKTLSLAHNRLGELVRYPNKLQVDYTWALCFLTHFVLAAVCLLTRYSDNV